MLEPLLQAVIENLDVSDLVSAFVICFLLFMLALKTKIIVRL
jgi:hypothetical protein